MEYDPRLEALVVAGVQGDVVRAIGIGLHQGPCLAVVSNERLDYFGQTVNVAARVQGLVDSQAIFATVAVLEDASVARFLEERRLTPTSRRAALRGITGEVTVYEVP